MFIKRFHILIKIYLFKIFLGSSLKHNCCMYLNTFTLKSVFISSGEKYLYLYTIEYI